MWSVAVVTVPSLVDQFELDVCAVQCGVQERQFYDAAKCIFVSHVFGVCSIQHGDASEQRTRARHFVEFGVEPDQLGCEHRCLVCDVDEIRVLFGCDCGRFAGEQQRTSYAHLCRPRTRRGKSENSPAIAERGSGSGSDSGSWQWLVAVACVG